MRQKIRLAWQGESSEVEPYWVEYEVGSGLVSAHGAFSVEEPGIVDRIKPLIVRLAMGLVNRRDEPVSGERLRCSTTGSWPCRALTCL
jgi:hypothetical protein